MASVAPGSATAVSSTADTSSTAAAESCGCTNIAIMQLFHELKQQFPAVPDRVVSECISQNFHDKEACEAILRRENQGYLLHSYPSCLKMSLPVSSEAEGNTRPRVAAPCSTAPSGAGAPAEGPSCTAVSVPGQPALSHVYFVNQTSASSASSFSSSLFSPASKARDWMESSDARMSSVKRTESRWSSTHVSNNSALESVASEVIKSTACGCGDVPVARPGVSSSSHTIVSQKEAASICRVGADPANAPQVFARPTTLNVSGGMSVPTHTVSSPAVGATHFNPFHSAQQNPHPASAGDRPPSEGDAGVPYTGSFRQRAHVFDSNATSRGRSDQHQSASRENIATSVYSDHTVVNSYQVNVNCSVRGGGSSSVNVSGTSSRTVVTTPEASVTTVSPPRPAPPPRPPPPHPKPKPRQRSAITVDPAPHYAHQGAWGGGGGTVAAAAPPQQPRSYTSVNLTLRPPSSEPQAPIDIQSAGSSLMYSTSSYDPRQGYQSKLQICIGPGGVGSVSAMRTRALEAPTWGAAPIPTALAAPAPSPAAALATPARSVPPPLPSRPPAVGTLLPSVVAPPSSQPPPPASAESTLDSLASSTHSDDIHRELQALRIETLQGPTRALLERQLERKTRLQHELRREKEKLRAMQRDVRGMEKDLAQRQLAKRTSAYDALPHLSTLQKVQRLRQEIHLLTEECKKMTMEVDMSSDSRVPLGETDEEFYKNIYTGQQGSITTHALHGLPNNRGDSSQQSARLPPPRPPPPEIDRESWTCTQCTFRNYWELEYCEQCEMPKLMLGTGPRPAPGAFCYCHPNPGKQLTPSVAAYPVYVPTPKLN